MIFKIEWMARNLGKIPTRKSGSVPLFLVWELRTFGCSGAGCREVGAEDVD